MTERASFDKTEAPGGGRETLPRTGDHDGRQRLPRAEADLVIGDWLGPPGEPHLGQRLADEVVCRVGADQPAVRKPRWWCAERHLESGHVARAIARSA